MANLTEKIVQESAQAFLYKRYRKRARRGRVFSKTEARTRRKYGGKRADGLLAFKHFIWGTYVVSMEAKSLKTLSAMKPKRDDNLFLWNCFKAGLKVCILSGMFFALYKMDDAYLQFVLPLNMLICSAIIYGFFTLHSTRHQRVSVLRQLDQYPANERWLAFSNDSWKALSSENRDDLEKISFYRGIGILIVSTRNHVKIRQPASMQWKWFGDFISYYSHEKKIREAIN